MKNNKQPAEFIPSDEAKKQGVCCTEEESFEAYYSDIDIELRRKAIEFLRTKIPPDIQVKWLALIKKYDGHEWFNHVYDEQIDKLSPKEKTFSCMYNPHFLLGMTIRNDLRRAGFGEKELGYHNLDCVYIYLLEDMLCWDGTTVGENI